MNTMIKQQGFWKNELEAPLLRKNANYIMPSNTEEVILRAKQLLDLIENKDIEAKVSAKFASTQPPMQHVECVVSESSNLDEPDRSTNYQRLIQDDGGRIRCDYEASSEGLDEFYPDWEDDCRDDNGDFDESASSKQITQQAEESDRKMKPEWWSTLPIATRRILLLDAERTFSSSRCRSIMVMVLARLWKPLGGDYHQGLGFVVAYLLLFLPPESVERIALALHRRYAPGYYCTAPVAYFRDARVLRKLIERRIPTFAAHAERCSIAAEAYCSKWFIGLCVHVLPYPALAEFFEAYLRIGILFLFKFGIALITACLTDLLASTDPSRIFAILRLDSLVYPLNKTVPDDPQPGSFFINIVHDAELMTLEEDLEKLREEALEEMRLAQEQQRKREVDLGLDTDDEIIFSDEDL